MLSHARGQDLQIRPEKEATDQPRQQRQDVVPVLNLVGGQHHHADVATDLSVEEKVPRQGPVPHGVVDESAG